MAQLFKNIYIVTISLVVGFGLHAGADVPEVRSARGDLVDARLRDLPVSASALSVIRSSSQLNRMNVAEVITMGLDARRAAFGQAQRLEREILSVLSAYELRFNLTGEELKLYVTTGRAPQLSRMSSIDAVPLPANARRALRRAQCLTLGDVRDVLLEPLLYGTTPLDEFTAREVRNLHQLPLPPDQAILTPEEYAFASALAEARLGQGARTLLREYGVRSLDDLHQLPLSKIAARGPVDKKIVTQIKSLFYEACATRVGSPRE